MLFTLVRVLPSLKSEITNIGGVIVREEKSTGLIDCQFDTSLFTVEVKERDKWALVKVRNRELHKRAIFFECDFEGLHVNFNKKVGSLCDARGQK